jgi:superfamily II DNA or RNA helicase
MNLNQFPFQGKFRTYQQRVLDQASNYLDDGKIHIVAAPGSGKTILGLELITRLNQPTLILSPSITIKHQWMERFVKNFLNDTSLESMYVSANVFDLKPITSITYQALHAAMNRMVLEESDEVESETEQIDFSQFDLIKQCQAFGIKTICLDEAHHLRSEWHKSLTNFIKALGNDIKIIALTATPPYDSSSSEWDKYIELCGDIDEEIFIPELVHQNTLAPHQDYIYFNYPSDAESELI